MLARFAGRCTLCGGHIAVGAAITKSRIAGKFVHAACVARAGDAQRAPFAAAARDGDIVKTGKLHARRFDSVAALTECAAQPAGVNQEKWNELNVRGKGKQWYGVENQKAAHAIFAAGAWPEGVERMLAALGDLQGDTKPRNIRRTRTRSDFGAEVDVTEYWRGRGDVAWSSCRREQRTGPQTVTVAINPSISAGEDAEKIFWRGAAALCLADKLTVAGYNVEIVLLFCVHGLFTESSIRASRDDDAVIECCVKSARAPLDLNALAVSACLGAFPRELIFKTLCT
ncbi:MAG: hypothetical protein E4H01_05905, partial [Lysobacterales bacterium]